MLYPLIGSMIGFFGIIICLVIISSKYQILLREKINHGLKIMFNFAFNSLYEAIYMNGHGIYVWSVVVLVIISLITFFVLYDKKIKKFKKKFNESN